MYEDISYINCSLVMLYPFSMIILLHNTVKHNSLVVKTRFKRNRGNAHRFVPYMSRSVSVLIWRVSSHEEINLDVLEGYPDTYEKDTALVSVIQLSSGEKLVSVEASKKRRLSRPVTRVIPCDG